LITYDETRMMLDDIAGELPEAFYKMLNGGIVLLPEVKFHPYDNGSGHLYTLGEYHNDRPGYGGLGRYITIYYGSFVRLYGHAAPEKQRIELRKVLIHEFTHHLESLAGDISLQVKDAHELARYKEKTSKTKFSYRRSPK